MKKLFAIITLFFVILSSISIRADDQIEAKMSVVEAISAIWKMNHKDISSLYVLVFPCEDSENKKKELTTCGKITECTITARVLETFESATLTEQEIIKKAIQCSYEEYVGISGAGVLSAVLVFPIGFPMLIAYQMEHIKKIEKQRAILS